MQSPITIGTLIQNRYRLTKILAQGGMTRTYLAEDQGRFNELCVLKELIPAQTENYASKLKERVQQEAAILAQIQHPQVSQFRVMFEQDQHLFLVQDYVEGKTYAKMLAQRRAVGQTFSEAEVLQLLRQLLPVLAYIHNQGIIHRDISPDHIIWRQSDRLPVLIDFGVVKELASRFQSPQMYKPIVIGKLGFAPVEQIQTGRAYPSSDLYALAVTSIVLLTGQEPQELFDDNHLAWNWQRWITLSPRFSWVLNRMLSYKPGDRYQSVTEVAQALQWLTNPIPPTRSSQVPTPDLSSTQTMAVDCRPNLISSNIKKPNQPAPVIAASKNRSIWDSPWATAVMGIVVAITAGIGSWGLVSSILAAQRSAPRPLPPQTFPSPLVSESSAPTSTVSDPSSAEPVKYSQHLSLKPGKEIILNGRLKANTTIDYTFRGEQGQQLSATLANQDVLLNVLGSDRAAIDDSANRVRRYQGILPKTGYYTVELSPIQGVTQSKYKLALGLENSVQPALTPTLTPTPTPSDTLTPMPTSSPTLTPTPTLSPTGEENQ